MNSPPTSITNIEKRATEALPELSTLEKEKIKNEERSSKRNGIAVIPEQKQVAQVVESSTSALLKTRLKETDNDSNTIKSQEEEDPSAEGVEIPDDRDVLSGRGAGVNLHPGNVYFRKLIQTNEKQYVKADPGGKKRLIRKIVQNVTEDRRFLKYDHNEDLWIRLSDEEIKKKVGQALREKAPAIKKERDQEILMKTLELERSRFARIPNSMVPPPLQYSPLAQPVASSQFRSSHQPCTYSLRGLLSQMSQLQEKQLELKRKQREVEDEQSQLIQHLYQITASLGQEMSSLDILFEAASNENRFDDHFENDFSRDPKKRRITPPAFNFYQKRL